MEKIKIGIPRGLFYDQFHAKWHYFFERLGCDVIESDPTNPSIIALGRENIGTEVCLLLQTYIGHVLSLKDKVDYIVIPEMESDQKTTCPYITKACEIIKNNFDPSILRYPIHRSKWMEMISCKRIGKSLGKKYRETKKVYQLAGRMEKTIKEKEASFHYHKLSHSGYKILMAGPSYLLHDTYLVNDMIRNTERFQGVVLMQDQLEQHQKKIKEKEKENEVLKQQLSGIIFVSTHDCCFDVKLKQMEINKSNLPQLNLNLDDDQWEIQIERFMKGIHEKEK